MKNMEDEDIGEFSVRHNQLARSADSTIASYNSAIDAMELTVNGIVSGYFASLRAKVNNEDREVIDQRLSDTNYQLKKLKSLQRSEMMMEDAFVILKDSTEEDCTNNSESGAENSGNTSALSFEAEGQD